MFKHYSCLNSRLSLHHQSEPEHLISLCYNRSVRINNSTWVSKKQNKSSSLSSGVLICLMSSLAHVTLIITHHTQETCESWWAEPGVSRCFLWWMRCSPAAFSSVTVPWTRSPLTFQLTSMSAPLPPPHLCFPFFNPTAIFKTSPGTLFIFLFSGWPLNLLSKCAVICCWPPSIFFLFFVFVFFLPKLWQNVTHPLANFPAPFEKETERGRGSGGHWGESVEIWAESGCRFRSVTQSHISAGLPSGLLSTFWNIRQVPV